MIRMIRRACLAVGLGVLFGAPATAATRQVHILAANDMHATISLFPQLAAIADSLRQLYPDLLVFSGGDNRTGNPLNDKYETPAYPMVALMNQVGFHASALGNHEFDVHSLPRLTGLANFSYLCANIVAGPQTGIHTRPCQVFDAGGVKVGVVGVIQLSPQGIPSTHPDNLQGLAFVPAMEVVEQYEWLSRECDVTILLSHLGYDDDRVMADAFPWLDVIIGGHTHTQLGGDEQENGVLITQNKNKLPRVTHITITVDSTGVVDKHSEYINVKTFGRRNACVEELVRYFSDNPAFNRVLAQATAPFEVREELGALMCDAYMEGCQAEIGVENPGGVRLESHATGDITVRDVLELDPFDNHAVVLTLTGHEIVEMLLSYCHHRLHSFPFVGGIRCELTLDKDNRRLVKGVRLLWPDGSELDMKRRYRVATNSYVSATSHIPEGAAQQLNVFTTDLIMQYLENHTTVDYQGVRRLKLR